jgi:hypothetical protein
MMGLKSLFRRKKKRKADKEPIIPQETDNTQIETIEETEKPEAPIQLEPSSASRSGNEATVRTSTEIQSETNPPFQ